MKANLMICLGNPMMGDDGAGWHIFRHLVQSAALPRDWEIRFGGTDLFSFASDMEGRRLVVVVDAVESPQPPGSLELLEVDQIPVEGLSRGAHQFSAVESVRLLQMTVDGLADVRFVLLAVAMASVRVGPNLSPELSSRLPRIVDKLILLVLEQTRSRALHAPGEAVG